MATTRRILGIPILATILLATGCFSPSAESTEGGLEAAARDIDRCATPTDEEDQADEIVQLVNLHRASAGLSPVMVDEVLQKASQDYACRMITLDFFAHEDPETGFGPGERAVDAGYSFFAVGENLAGGRLTPAEVVRLWMESPSHRDNILDPRWKEVGVGVRIGGDLGTYWVLELGDPAARNRRPI